MALKRVPARFFLTRSGADPVRSWLMSLPPTDRAVIGQDIATLEFGWPIGMPLCRALGDGLWEIRSDLPSRRTARVLFCIAEGHLVLLHAFIKTSQRTPKDALALARSRMGELER